MLLDRAKEISNQENLIELLDYFDLSEDSLNYLRRVLRHRTDEAKVLDGRLRLGEDLRISFPVKIPLEESPAFLKYRDLIFRYDYKIIEYNPDSWVGSYLNLDVFKSGIYLDEKSKQPVKLFKHLLKIGIPKEAVEEVTTLKNSSEQLYLTLSRNPVDYLMCSTGQSFKSCMGLESKFEGAFYMGLPSIFNDHSRFIAFTSNGKPYQYTIKGMEFNYFRYHQRTWVLYDPESDKISIERHYPNHTIRFDPIMEKELNLCTGYIDHSFKSKVIRNLAEEIIHVYPDKVGVEVTDGGDKYYYLYDLGSSGIHEAEYNWKGGFEELSDPEDLRQPYYEYECDWCGEGIDDYTYVQGDCVCDHCAETEAARCSHCGELEHIAHIQEVHNGDEVCRLCMSEHYLKCSDCDGIHLQEDLTSTEDGYVCAMCLSDYELCSECVDGYTQDDSGKCGLCLGTKATNTPSTALPKEGIFINISTPVRCTNAYTWDYAEER